MLDNYIKEQPIACQIIKNAILKNRCSHAYLIEAKEYERKYDFVLSIARYFLCPNHHTQKPDKFCPICSKTAENILDLKWIRSDGMWIKKSQMEELQDDFGKKPLESNKKIYIIENADRLNESSANAILKFLEEPEENIIALLIVDNLYQVLPTIVSRCQIISLKNVRKYESNDTVANLSHFIIGISIDKDKVDAIVNFAIFLEKNGQATILYENNLWLDIFPKKEDMLIAFDILLYFYKDIIEIKCDRFIEIFRDYSEIITNIAYDNDLIQLCDKIGLIMEAKESVMMNLNMNLVLDHLICKMKEVKICRK